MDILRDHQGGICMHGGFETTSAMVSELRRTELESGPALRATHWLTGDSSREGGGREAASEVTSSFGRFSGRKSPAISDDSSIKMAVHHGRIVQNSW